MSATRTFRSTVALALALVAAACSNVGGPSGDDATAPAGTGSDRPTERAVQFVGAGRVRLFGTLTTPAMPAGLNVPGVLIVPTAGAGDRNGLLGPTGVSDPLGRELAVAFTAAGLATYRYDQRGTGESRLEPDVRLSLDDVVADARAALDVLSERAETAGKNLAMVGYDQGGLLALRLAAIDDRVKRLVLVSTPGRSLAGRPGRSNAGPIRARVGRGAAHRCRRPPRHPHRPATRRLAERAASALPFPGSRLPRRPLRARPRR